MLPVSLVSQIPPTTGVALPAIPVVVPVNQVPNVASTQPSQDNTQHNETKQQDSSRSRGAEVAALLSKIYNKQPDTLKYSVDRDTGIILFRIIDPDTKEVIRQIPPEEIIALAKLINESGLLLDERG